MKLAVLVKDGFETIEALSVVDIFRRAQEEVSIIGMDSEFVTSSQGIIIKADEEFGDDTYTYDGLVIPGGLPGATNLQKDHRVLEIIQKFNEQGKICAAICAGPIVLASAGILKGKQVTCYPGFEDQLLGGLYQDELVVCDHNIITGRGPGASLEFGYRVLEAFGKDSQSHRDSMQYTYLLNKKSSIL